MKYLLIFLLFLAHSFGAISSTVVWELRTTGSDTNGGGFKTGASGTDYSQQDSAQYALTGLTSSGAGAIILTASAATDMVGNTIQITGGTNFTAGFYEITAVSAGVSITVDTNVTTGVGAAGTGNIGGALLTPDKVDDGMVAGNICYIKSGTYTRTSGWALTLDGTAFLWCQFIGYNTNRNEYNTDTKPLITTSTNSTNLIAGNGATFICFRNIEWSNTAGTNLSLASNATAQSTDIIFVQCKMSGFVSVCLGNTTAANTFLFEIHFCELSGFTAYAMDLQGNGNQATLTYCYIHDSVGAVSHAQVSSSVIVDHCIFDTLSAYAITLTRTSTALPILKVTNSVFYNCSSGGINMAGNSAIEVSYAYLVNNIFWGGTYGLRQANAGVSRKFLYATNAYGNQGTAARLNFASGSNDITITADPFVDAPNGNFALNNTSGGGLLLRGLGFPSSYPGALTSSYSDASVAQHQESVPPTVAY